MKPQHIIATILFVVLGAASVVSFSDIDLLSIPPFMPSDGSLIVTYDGPCGHYGCLEINYTGWIQRFQRLEDDRTFLKSANQSVTGTTLANITGLSFTANANERYTYSCTIYYRSSALTNGVSFAPELTGGSGSIRQAAIIYGDTNTISTPPVSLSEGIKSTSTGVLIANTVYLATLEGAVSVNTQDITVTPQYSSELAGQTVTIVEGSSCEVRRA